MFNIEEFLRKVNKTKASDIHLKIGKSPSLRIAGNIVKIDEPPITEEDFENMLNTMLYGDLAERIKAKNDIDFTYEILGVSRYRVNYCKELGYPKLTLRTIPYAIPTLEELALPTGLEVFTKYNNGIVLITGATSSGKSTTIASLLEIINKDMPKHIVTIEDPIEFLYTDKKCLITQRGVGVDVNSFSDGIKYALRQDPDIIVVGEIRDRDTMESALNAAETGHLVFSTIHTNSASQTINRILGLFDDSTRGFIRDRFAKVLRGTIAQKLIPKTAGGLVPALEIMCSTPAIVDYIRKNQLEEVDTSIKRGGSQNMVSMNASIFKLFKSGIIGKDEAMNASDDTTELSQMMRGIYHGSAAANPVDDLL